jgi:hypothetical protein
MNVYNINKLKKHKNIYQVSTETGIDQGHEYQKRL